MTYDEAKTLPAKYKCFTYSIVQGPDDKIYNISHISKEILLVRDPLNTKFKVDQLVLVNPLG